MSAKDFSDAPSAVRDGQAFDTSKLDPWLRERVAGLSGALEVMQFGRGFSNLTSPTCGRNRRVRSRTATTSR
jgi:aminoglycoside phosphotransferase (APT) family kinase protein